MAPPSSNYLLLLLLFSFFLITSSQAQPSFRPKALILIVSKDPSTLQYLTQINQRTPLLPLNLTLDLGGQYLWVDCQQRYLSSSYKPVRCGSAQCSLSNSKSCITQCFSPRRPGCNNNTCGLGPDNTVTQTGTSGELGQDLVSVQSTDGRIVQVRNFLFTCVSTFLLDGLAKGVKGMAGLGRTRISMPSLFSAAFSFSRKFAVCLASSGSKGAVFFGDGPYFELIYTPLILNKVSTASAYFAGDPSSDYFIGVSSIKVNNRVVPVNTTLLKIDDEGYGGTKISTVQPYTVLETSIYRAVVAAFGKEMGTGRVGRVRPFELCYNSTRAGPAVPRIDLVLQSRDVYWRIYGGNSMVEVRRDVMCLGFVDGGVKPRTSIVIGGHQVEDNLLQFDLAASRLGFSSSLLIRGTSCANFNFSTGSSA